MILINPDVERWQQPEGKEGVFAMIERVARVCYKSENTSGITARKFVAGLLDKDHGRPLEFGSVYLRIPDEDRYAKAIHIFLHDEAAWSKCVFADNFWYVSTNFRCIAKHPEEGLLSIFENYWCEPTQHHEHRHCFHFTLSRGIADEYRTHVALSSMMQSTRYCNYTKDKFGGEVRYAKPEWYRLTEDNVDEMSATRLEYCCKLTENESAYKSLLASGRTPQEARDILGLGVATELVMCGYDEAWLNFFYRRCDAAAHPDARYLATKTFAKYKEI